MTPTVRTRERGRALSALLYAALVAVGFFGVSAAIRPLVPWPSEYGLRDKFEHFEEHCDEYDLLFLGSSRLWRSIIPPRFDEEMALRGVELRSFNFGVGGMRVWEMDYVLHRVLELQPKKLKWIVIEGGDWDPDFPSVQNTFASRSVFWHNLAETRKAIGASFTADEGLGERLRLALIHAQLFLWKTANYGQGRIIVRDVRGIRAGDFGREREEGYFVQDQGFQTQDTLVHPNFRRNLETYKHDVSGIDAANAAEVDLDHVYAGAIERQYEAAAELGIELICIIPPGIEGAPVRLRLHEEGVIPTLFDFNQPKLYPDLFRVQARFSPDHLNLNGARELTHVLAKTFSRHLRGVERD
ncbi:MAG: hypothetical protein AAF682_05025 [Planctomycetota bacterium]